MLFRRIRIGHLVFSGLALCLILAGAFSLEALRTVAVFALCGFILSTIALEIYVSANLILTGHELRLMEMRIRGLSSIARLTIAWLNARIGHAKVAVRSEWRRITKR